MEAWKSAGIGAALILAACSRDHDVAKFRAVDQDGRAGFELWLPQSSWQELSAGRPLEVTLLDRRAEDQLQTLIEAGIARRKLPCPGNWIVNRISSTEPNGMLFSGYCATAAEIQEAHREYAAGAT